MNLPHVIEVALLLLVAYLIGCVLGYLARRVFAPPRPPAEAPPAPAEAPAPPSASALPTRSKTEIATRVRSTTTISGAMAGAATAAGASDIAAQAVDPDAGDGEETGLVAEGEGAEDIADLERLDAAPEPAPLPEEAPPPEEMPPGESAPAAEPSPPAPADMADEASLDSIAAADAGAGAGNRPASMTAPRGGEKDDLKTIKGIGPKLEATLNSLGIYHFDQIAAWSRGNVEWVDTYLSFRGRIDRDDWIAQARALAGTGDSDGG